jgi:hypothetical protein
MTRLKGLNRWLAPPLIAVLLGTNLSAMAYASVSASPSAVPSCETGRGHPPDRPIPKGQLVRRGVTGTVVAVTTDTPFIITVETQFGNVEIIPPEGFDLSTVEEGSRIASLLVREPVPVGGGGTATDTPFRTATASRIKVVPRHTSYTHEQAVIIDQEGDSLEVVDEDGNVGEVEITGDGGVQIFPEGETSNLDVEPETVEVGTDAILLTQCTGLRPTAQVRSIQRADRIAQRLERLQEKFAADPEKATKFAQLQQRHEEREQARLERTSSNAPASVRGSVDKARGQGRAQDCSENEGGKDCPDQTRGKSGGRGGG